ncbi:hypothetical protein [Pseudoxanthomonas yeongjuensis]|uniref:hypothetical protein n=1 Tax=Pseudoxanthomonas yeongjuensis TaxID=377616 RepID=UPI001390AFC7|nr:hypothetical protein [Pseudoxanthomonas yeongjuensis]
MFNWQDKERLEENAAAVLGRILWETGSLEAGLGLVLAWSRGGAELDSLTKEVEPLGFNGRLKLLERIVAACEREPSTTLAYSNWLQDAHALRMRRNSFVHGRWAVTGDGMIVNVVGLMTSPDQVETRYSLTELEAILAEILELHQRLRQLHTNMGLGP